MTRVKVCGVRTPEDARACVAAGADAIGFLVDVALSPRRIGAAQARAIADCLPPFVAPVAVMMPSSAEEVAAVGRRVRPGAIQLHGEEPPEMLRQIRRLLPWTRLIKAIHVGTGDAAADVVARARAYEGSADALLLDTLSPAGGGSGTAHDWGTSAQVIDTVGLPVMLAGGLTPANVADAVRIARPFAVDVSSGVENGQYRKDREKVKAFIARARSV